MEKTIVFITGVSSGIGRGLVHRFLKEESFLVCGISRKELDIAELTQEQRDRFLYIPCDVRQKESVRHAVDQCVRHFGSIDMLIANAGIGYSTPGFDYNSKIIEDIMQTNVMGAVYAIESVLPFMIRRKKGQIVGISSLAAYRGLPWTGGYCASKAALSALLESLRLDLNPYHISVTTIHPGYIKTPLTARNRYPMPFLLDTDEGVQRVYQAIRKKKKNYSFPWPLFFLLKLSQWLPSGVYDFFMSGKRPLKN